MPITYQEPKTVSANPRPAPVSAVPHYTFPSKVDLPPAIAPGRFIDVRRNVGAYIGRGGAITFLVNPSAVVAVDAQNPAHARHFYQHLPGRRGRPIDALIVSHHHVDHVGGLGVLRSVTDRIVAHERVVQLQYWEATYKKTASYQVYADTVYQDPWRYEAGDEVVHARYIGTPAHSGGDTVIYFEKANVLAFGDLAFNRRRAPNLDRPTGGNAKQWIEALTQLVKEYPSDTIYLFSHSGETPEKRHPVVGSKDDILRFRDYLSGLYGVVERAVREGHSVAEISDIALEPPRGFEDFIGARPGYWPDAIGSLIDEVNGVPPAIAATGFL